LSADTIVPDPTNPQSFNRYSYVRNNPIGYKDPSGHDRCGAAGEVCIDEPPLTPTNPPIPTPDPVVQQLLDSTVQIKIGNEFSHGYIVNGNTILTHDHYTNSISGSTIAIYDTNGTEICNPCNLNSGAVKYHLKNGDVLDLTELGFSGTPFSGYSSLDVNAITSADLIGQDIYVTSYHTDNTTASGYRTDVVKTTILDTAYVTNGGSISVPNKDGLFSGYKIDFAVPQGSSGGPAATTVDGNLVVIGLNSSKRNGYGFIATTYR